MPDTLDIVFAGTPDFAVPTLQTLLASPHRVVAVYTQPDRPAGRGRKLTPSPVKQCALAHDIPVFQPASLKTPAAQAELAGLRPDLMVVVAYGLLLPKAVLAIPRLGCVNVHASLLPRWRGAAPIQRAILAGDSETGITIMHMDEGLDTGPMLATVSCPIRPDDTAQSLHDRLATLGNPVLLEAIEALAAGTARPRPQDDSQAVYAAKLDKAEATIDWSQTAAQIDRQVRAFNPWPVAQTHFEGQPLRIWSSEVPGLDSEAAPGTVVACSGTGIDVATGDGVLRICECQPAGKRRMAASDFANARPALREAGTRLGQR
jgi:methionyl-tRNA formyltransferase